MEGSHQIMKSLNTEEPLFATFDLSSGYHQCRLDPRDRDLFSVILPQGKYRFKVLPQGIKPASDLINILTDPGLRNQEGFYKNMDDILCAGSNIKQLERRLRSLLEVCRTKNMKLKPQKFTCGTSVTYGGCVLSSVGTNGSRQVLITPETAKLDALLNIDRPTTKRGAQVVIGMLNQLSGWIPDLSFKAKGLRQLTGNRKFVWSSDLEKEWLEMKKAIKKSIALSPLDPTLPIHLHCDAAKKCGMGFVLSQPRRDGRGIPNELQPS